MTLRAFSAASAFNRRDSAIVFFQFFIHLILPPIPASNKALNKKQSKATKESSSGSQDEMKVLGAKSELTKKPTIM
jgi:hypothetical protein